MNCEQVQELLSPYIDDVLETDAVHAVDRHLETCGECSKEYQELVSMISMLKAMGDEDLPEGFNERLMGRIKAVNPSRKRFLIPSWLPAGAAAAILVALFFGAAPRVFQMDEQFIQGDKGIHQEIASDSQADRSNTRSLNERAAPVEFASGGLKVKTGSESDEKAIYGQKTTDKQVNSVESQMTSPQPSDRSPTPFRARDGGYSAKGAGDEAKPEAATTDGSSQVVPEEDAQFRVRAFSAPAPVQPFLHLVMSDLGSAQGKLTNVAKSAGGTIQSLDTAGAEGKKLSFVVTIPRHSLAQFLEGVSALGEVVQDNIADADASNVLDELESQREDLKNQAAKAGDSSEIKRLQEEIARIDAKIEGIQYGTLEVSQTGLVKINILVEEKGN